MAIDVTQQEENKSGGTAALPAVPPAVRREQQFSPDALDETDDPALDDISTILLGSKAISGKTMMSSSQVARTADTVEAHRGIDDKKRADDDRAARERMNLAAWNAQKTIVGGVEMTNAEAQTARKSIIDNIDFYADRAVAKGLIREDEKEEFKRNAVRKYEYQKKRADGSITAAEDQAEKWQDQSRTGKALDIFTAETHENKGLAYQESQQQNSKIVLRQTPDRLSSLDAKDLFSSAPELNSSFTNAANPATATPAQNAVAAVDPRVKASGLNL